MNVSMITFNGAALIADGEGEGILKYDGSTVGYIPDSPEAPMCITTIANRVVCASASTPDYVYFSGPNDLEDWATSDPGAAVTIPAGFGDGYDITGFAVIYDALIVSKVKRDSNGAIVGRKMYAIITTGVASNWSVKLISSENAAMLPGAMVGVGEMAYLVDTNGFKAVSPTPNGQYGDVGVDAMVGVRVNKLINQISRTADLAMMTYIPSLAQIWFTVGTPTQARTFFLHPIQGAFTQADFGTFVPRAVCEVGQKVYLAGNDGALYSLANHGYDELSAGVWSPVYATLRTRTFEGLGGDLILKKTKVVLDTIRPATVLVEAYLTTDRERISLGSVDMGAGSASTPVYEAYDLVVDADYDLSDSKVAYEPLFYGGPRATGMALQVRVNGGRVALNSLTAEFAVVGS